MRCESSTRTLKQEVAALRRRVRHLTCAGVLVGVAAVSVALLGAGPQDPVVITAREFQIVDDDGTVRAILGTQPDGCSGLYLYDKTSRSRVVLDTKPDGRSGLYLYDKNGTGRVGVDIHGDEVAGITLADDPSHPTALFVSPRDGESCLYLYSKNGTPKVTLQADEQARLSLRDDKNRQKFLVFVKESGNPVLLMTKNHESLFRVNVDGNETPELVITEANGKEAVHLPKGD